MITPAYLISDVHLTLRDGKEERERRRRLALLLDEIRATGGTLIIVGDFFDFWFEYKHVIPRRYFDVLAQLAALRQAGVEIHFVLGNHDYWTRNFLSDILDIKIYRNGADMVVDGLHVRFTHGDGLLPSDRGYRWLRRMLRSAIVVTAFRWLHPDIGIYLAQKASRLSRKYNPPKERTDEIISELSGFLKTCWDQGLDAVIMGHYHLSKLIQFDNGKIYFCLGDGINHFTYGKIADRQITLEHWPD
ncbi:MAG: UDP-2,3-diacylglucosamine diphosphatase [Candidatus Marinimicrobia bacterium]|nr:UDP-2,3-diacylglucosamine diphosphatase [Candidatus Neomarinimicrobiota bacterium]